MSPARRPTRTDLFPQMCSIQKRAGSEELPMTQRNAAKWIAPLALTFSVALLGACGGGSESESQTSSTTPEVAANAATAVEITEFAFVPKEIRISVGESVRWINRDEFLHTVTSGAVDGPENEPDGQFDKDLDEVGSEAMVTFDDAGTFTYFCKQHNAMDGVVIVESN